MQIPFKYYDTETSIQVPQKSRWKINACNIFFDQTIIANVHKYSFPKAL
jgi:hypothetical protein